MLKQRMIGALIGLVLGFGSGSTMAQQADTEPVRTTQLLQDNWKFIQDDELSDGAALTSEAGDWQTVSLPHTWNAEDAASYHSESYKRGVGWYRLEFPSPSEGTRHWLEFGAASLVADVWLNGQKLGEHKGAFTIFRFDVTDKLVTDGPNLLFVKADNSEPQKDSDRTAIPPMRGDFNVSGGLYRYVSLVSTPEAAHFDLADMGGSGVYGTTSSITEDKATLNVRTKLRSDAADNGDYVVRISLVGADGQVAGTAEQTVSLAANSSAEVAQDVNVTNPHLWQGVEDSYLYRLVAELLTPEGRPIDKLVHSYGIREMRFDPQHGFFLNGKHVRLAGVGMQFDLLGKGWAQSEADIDNSLQMIREMGANVVRFAHFPYGQHALQKASELGLVVWAEAAFGIYTTVDRCATIDPTHVFAANAQQQLRELIRQQFNFAAIALWAVGNESTQGQLNCKAPYDNVTPLLREMHATAKSEDPSRPTAYAEYPHSIERSGPFATENITDLFATNRYYMWYTPEVDQFGPLLTGLHAKVPRQPLAVSEYGGGAALTHHTDNPTGGYPEVRSAPEGQVSYQPEEYASYLHEQIYRVIAGKPYLWGSFVWIMFDFGSAHRNEGDVLGVNTKGVVAFDHRTRKDPFYFYKANWSREPVTYITGRRYTDRAYGMTDVKVYSNADSVELSVNGEPAGRMSVLQCPQRTCVFENVPLRFGNNTVVAVGDHAGNPVTDMVQWSLNTRDVNIAAGRLVTGLVSSEGKRFGSDNFFSGGQFGPGARELRATDVFAATAGSSYGGNGDGAAPVTTNDLLLYKYYRQGTFSYDIPLEDGRYGLTLGFIEPLVDAEMGGRVFNVAANGQTLLENFDVLDEAGQAGRPVKKTFTVDVVGGHLVLNFSPTQGNAIVSTIEVTPLR